MKEIISTLILVLVFSVSVFAQNEKSLCPKIGVNGGGLVRPGEPTYFTAHIGNDTDSSKFEYEWTISAGTIIEGLGSQTIKVDTTGLADAGITATVKVKGLPENCANTASEITVCNCIGDPLLLDEFGKLPAGEVKARIDNLYLKLGNEKNSQGYIISYGTNKEIAGREKQIQRAIAFLRFDASRITIVRGGTNPNGTGVLTKVWIVPPGVVNPQP